MRRQRRKIDAAPMLRISTVGGLADPRSWQGLQRGYSLARRLVDARNPAAPRPHFSSQVRLLLFKRYQLPFDIMHKADYAIFECLIPTTSTN